MTRLVPETYDDDTVFLYASKVVHNTETDTWIVHIDPDNRLAGVDNTPLEEIRNADPTVTTEGTREIYEGKILFSAGVIFLVNDRIALLQRDEEAPADPGKWTSPAGRCEHDPGTTALKEFYEELVITANERPVFVQWCGCSDEHFETYRNALSELGKNEPINDWQTVRAETPESFRSYFSTVRTKYDGRHFRDDLLTYYDTDANTLEFRFVLRITPSPEFASSLTFADGEFNRDIGLFDPKTLQSMSSDDLVSMDAYFARKVLSSVDTV
ncbi:hypothetical protein CHINAEXTREME_17805 [Halobiforma lacisalsi AJ5]|uniref:Nudix hydrolase domain-containing protein n=1 Tax=Natronobacterium lacisalsi AJ5 TaxID=358396 RepID=M0LI10_NATLA|nr:NUDIX hydrolase [Halobiforma lacisalsi]APW99507.1 hypothetical protein CHINAEXTREME_17805 [Halobiforma lacisalsi AJ5]EMA31630.1 hypothetical protein C445_14147 [Halobiforma lacisalsi AJ5]